MKSALLYNKSDYFRYTGKESSIFKMLLYTFHNHSFRYCFWLRLAAFPNILTPFARMIRTCLASRYGILISRRTKIGYGLYLGHGYGIIINSTAIIGNNCNISQFTTIGSNEGCAATIGDNVYIGPSVCVVENIRIGDNVTVGAGAVITRDIPNNATCAGVPAKILHFDNPARYINNKWNN